MNKGQGLPINTIILAALALVVLLILMWLTGGKLLQFGKGVSEGAAAEVCAPPNQVMNIAACNNPLLGDYSRVDPPGSTNYVRLSPSQVCCPP